MNGAIRFSYGKPLGMVNSTSKSDAAVTPITEKLAVTDRTMEGECAAGGSSVIARVAANGGGGGPPLAPALPEGLAQCDPKRASTATRVLPSFIPLAPESLQVQSGPVRAVDDRAKPRESSGDLPRRPLPKRQTRSRSDDQSRRPFPGRRSAPTSQRPSES